MLSLFTNIISGIGTALIIYLMMNRILTMRRRHFLLSLLALAAFYFAGTTIVYSDELTGTLSILAILLLTAVLLYKDRLLVKISAVFIIYPIATSISYLTRDLGFTIWLHFFHENLSANQELLLSTAMNILQVMLWYLIYRSTRNWIARVSKELNNRMWLVIDAISITSCIGIVTIIYKSSILGSYAAYPVCISSILTGLGACYLCSYISRTLKSEMEIQTLKYQQSYYQEMEENQKEVRRLRHDMKNHLNIIGTFLRDDDLEQAKEYFADLSDEFSVGTHTFCDHSIVNAVLNAKYNLAVREQIDCKMQVDLNESIRIDDLCLCSLLANTLDNAIEACRKISSENPRWIVLKARSHKGHFSYEISNSKVNDIINHHRKIITDKEDKTSHGIGLKTVSEIVERHLGHMDISHTDDDFSITVII